MTQLTFKDVPPGAKFKFTLFQVAMCEQDDEFYKIGRGHFSTGFRGGWHRQCPFPEMPVEITENAGDMEEEIVTKEVLEPKKYKTLWVKILKCTDADRNKARHWGSAGLTWYSNLIGYKFEVSDVIQGGEYYTTTAAFNSIRVEDCEVIQGEENANDN